MIILFLCASALLGFILGGAAMHLVRGQKIARLSERLSSKEEELCSERITKEKLQNEFKLAALEVLQQARTESDQNLDFKKQEITFSVNDMKSRLEDTQKIIREFEGERAALYAKMEQTLSQVLNTEQLLRIETNALKNALTSSTSIRGNWGQKVLEEILEQNDFVKGIHFNTQVFALNDAKETTIPDFVIKLSGNRRLVIDVKEVGGEYLAAQKTEDPAEQKVHYEKLVQNIRTNFIKLSRKEYQSQIDPNIPFVIMFIPSEAAIRAAFATDPHIFQEATERRVILASPMTIIPLIYLIKHGQQQEKLAGNARELGLAVEELGNRIFTFVDHLASVQKGIKKAYESCGKAFQSWQKKVSPQIEKTKSLGGKLKELPSLESIPEMVEDSVSLENNS